VLVGILVAMMLGVELAGLGGVVRGMMVVPVGDMGMMGGGHMIVVVMVLGGQTMMMGRLVVMLGGLAVMFGDVGFGHGILQLADGCAVRAARVRFARDRPVPFR
jgi:hypothetical protein